MQKKQSEWRYQWENFPQAEEAFLFENWIYPTTLQDFQGKEVLECGCGSGRHTSIVAPLAHTVTAVDLNTAEVASQQRQGLDNVTFVDADLGTMELGRTFDIVYCIGVIHHTDNPDRTFATIKRHARPGGKLIVWAYSREGNWLVANIVEPIRNALLARLPRRWVWWLSAVLTVLMILPIYTIYLLPLKWLPYYEYFVNFRRMSFQRNALNVFDKLNAPQTHFIDRARIGQWFSEADFDQVHISPYCGVSWRGSGVLRAAARH